MIQISQFDHIGIRVADRERALAFYRQLGFSVIHEPSFDAVAILKNDLGIEINLILNGLPRHNPQNILMDVPDKHTGLTHVAFKVADINSTIASLKADNITITQGPVGFGDGHVSVFIRDPDRNTIELRARLLVGDEDNIPGLVRYDPKG